MANKEHIDHLHEANRYSIDQFERGIIWISSGAFIVSFIFINDVIDFVQAKEKWWIISAWSSFACVVFLSLIGHFVSNLGAQWAIKINELPKDEFNKAIMKWNLPLRILNAVMILGIAIGAFCLIKFVIVNIILPT